jgi:hypothetical protein
VPVPQSLDRVGAVGGGDDFVPALPCRTGKVDERSHGRGSNERSNWPGGHKEGPSHCQRDGPRRNG